MKKILRNFQGSNEQNFKKLYGFDRFCGFLQIKSVITRTDLSQLSYEDHVRNTWDNQKGKKERKSFDFHTFISPRRDFHEKFHDNSVLESRFI